MTSPPHTTYGDLELLAAARGYTLPQLARRAGLSESAIWRIAHGQRRPRATTVMQLARALRQPRETVVQAVHLITQALPESDS